MPGFFQNLTDHGFHKKILPGSTWPPGKAIPSQAVPTRSCTQNTARSDPETMHNVVKQPVPQRPLPSGHSSMATSDTLGFQGRSSPLLQRV